jgi:hypothetical protein
LWFYEPILWIALAAYVVLVIPKAGHYGQYGLLFLAVLGLVAAYPSEITRGLPGEESPASVVKKVYYQKLVENC